MGAPGPLFERDPSPSGRPCETPLREVLNARFYVLRGGNSWRAIPHDLPAWDNVYDHDRRWTQGGTLERVHDPLCNQVRTTAGREATPSAVILDSQLAKTTERGDPAITMGAKES